MADITFPTAKVVFRAAAIAQDSGDSGRIPQEVLLAGIRVLLVPSIKFVEVAFPPGGATATTYGIRTWNLTTTSDGRLINPEDPDEEILIIASDAFPGRTVTWQSIIDDPSGTIPRIVKTWLAPADSTIDLTTVGSVPNAPNPIADYLQAVYDARDAADRAVESAALASESAASLQLINIADEVADLIRGKFATFDSTTSTPMSEINEFITSNTGKVVILRGEVVAWSSLVVPSNTTLDLRAATLYHKGAITLVNKSYADETLDIYDSNIRIIGGNFRCLDSESTGSHLFFSRVNNLWIQDMNVTEWQADWCVTLKRCRKAHISGLTLDGVVGGVGADGLHLYASSDVTVSDSVIFSGDDAISMTVEDFAIPDADGTLENITITNCTLHSTTAAALKIACANAMGIVRNITVSNCAMQASSGIGAVSISNATTTTTVDNIQISDCLLENTFGFGAPILQAYGVGTLVVTDCQMIAHNLVIPIKIEPSYNDGLSPYAKSALFSRIRIFAVANAECDVIADIHGIEHVAFDQLVVDGAAGSTFHNGLSLGADYPITRSEVTGCYFGSNCGGSRVSWHSGALRVINNVFDSDHGGWVINCTQANTNALEILNNDLHRVPSSINLDLATGPRVVRNNLGITDDNDLSAILNAILNGS